MRSFPWLVLLVCVLALTVAPSTSRGSTGAGAIITVEYSGVLDESFVYDPNRPALWQETLHFTWSEKQTARIGSDGNPVVTGKPTIKVGGTVRVTRAPPNSSGSCTGAFSLRPKTPDPFTIGTDSASALMPKSPDYVKSSSTVRPCDAVGASGTPWEPPFDVKFNDAVIAHCTVSKSPCKIEINSSSPTNVSSVRATLKITKGSGSGGTGGGSTNRPLTPALIQAKRNAREALRSSLANAAYPCLVAYSGAGLLAVPLATMPGAVLFALATPLCTAWVKTIYEQAKTANDPPRADYGSVAKVARTTVRAPLPPCAKFGSTEVALCRRVEATATAYLKAVGKVEAVSAAILTTVERASGAAAAGQSAAVAKQERALVKLRKQLAAAETARRKAGRSFAAALRETKTSIKLTKKQVAAGFAAVKTGVKSRGLAPKKLASIAGARLTPGPLDVLDTFGR